MKSEKMWNQLAKNWDTPGVSLGENDLRIIERAKKYLDASSVVLDYGCATGSIALEIAGMAKEVHGIDISANMVEIASRKAGEHKIENVAFTKATIFDESLKRESFDLILALSVLRAGDGQDQSVVKTWRHFHLCDTLFGREGSCQRHSEFSCIPFVQNRTSSQYQFL